MGLTMGLLLLVGLAACSQTNAGTDNISSGVPSLLNKEQIIEFLGVPDDLIHDADGTVLVYEHKRTEGMNLSLRLHGVPLLYLGNEQTRADRIEFQCDTGGRLVSVTTFQGTDAIDRSLWPF
jgi:hypothetical protein